MTDHGVRREKTALSSGCKAHRPLRDTDSSSHIIVVE
jgi:hypothetical protein